MSNDDQGIITVTIRIPEGLKTRLDEMAKGQGGRSFSSLVRQILEEAISADPRDESEKEAVA